MTDRERAVVMAYTGACMLTGDKLGIFYKYVEEIMGRPVSTFEMAYCSERIKNKAKADFIELCKDEHDSGKEPKAGKYEYHIDHTDCIWYGSGDNTCPNTCSQYRDGWNDAMEYIYKDGKGYQPYRRK